MAARILRRVVNGIGRRIGLISPEAVLSGREEAREWYDRMYAGTPEYLKSYEQSLYYFLWSVIVDRVRSSGHKRVLEIGCGPGQLAAYLLEQGVEVYTGLDFSLTAVEMARKRVAKGTFVVGDARDPSIHRQVEHDLVICTEVLEHVDADLLVVSHFQSGKRCLCSVPNFPYPSHVRHFATAAEVRARYGPYFDPLDIVVLKSPNDPTDQFYLMDGRRNDRPWTAAAER